MAKLLLAFALCAAVLAQNDGLRFATNYGSHMVLQSAPKQSRIWGICSTKGTCGSEVVVHVTGPTSKTNTVAALTDGNYWSATLDAVEGGMDAYTVTVSDSGMGAHDTGSSATISDVLFGDVWVCSGQSNMAFLLENAFNGSDFVQDANNWPQIRLFTSKKTQSKTRIVEQPLVEEPWSVSSNISVSQNAKPHSGTGVGSSDDNWLYMSAVCWLYGREIAKSTNKPVGLVNTNWGGTPVEFWASSDALAQCPDAPKTDDTVGEGGFAVSGAYHGMVEPLLNMTIHGVVWYQGESNQGDKWDYTGADGRALPSYACRFPAMIQDWRAKWHDGTGGLTDPDFPFGFVQLAAWVNAPLGPAGIRWAQSLTLRQVKNTFMPVAIDLGDRKSPYGSVHIRDKGSVGYRLGLGGRAVAYGEKSAYWAGPVASVATLNTGTGSPAVVLTFTDTGSSGLEVKNKTVGWELCTFGEPKNANCSVNTMDGWVAGAVTDSTSTTVTVAVTAVHSATAKATAAAGGTPSPMGVRYAWSGFPCEYKACSVYAKDEALPASPFVIYTQ